MRDLEAFAERLPAEEARRALATATAVAVGSVQLDRGDRRTIVREWQEALNGSPVVTAASTSAQVAVAAAAMGLTVERVPAGAVARARTTGA